MSLLEYRNQIDELDAKLLKLFEDRMVLAKQIADYKKENNMAVLDSGREREKLAGITNAAKPDMAEYDRNLFTVIMDLSKAYQRRLNRVENTVTEQIKAAIDANSNKMLPKHPVVACQGVEGAYSQIAADKIFQKNANIVYLQNFEGVFAAVDSGMCRYGVLPLENSTAGSVTRIYDLMMKYNFYIVKSMRLKVEHNLLVKEGVNEEDIKEIFSHEQAISQCSEFLKNYPNAKVTVVENTAVAAKMVASSDRMDVAAISSRDCANLYGLKILKATVQDKGNNFTRFICISKDMEIYPGADRTSIMMAINHNPGELYKILSRFYALGINLTKLESRPMPDRNFEFMFYFDLETSVYSEEFIQIVSDLSDSCEQFKYLGSYSEIV
ncbi:MAG: prephenate dehydratase [Lachnospiraceae bacterium]|nr:prephenate dehydratase [Lachnospiraceae bacterium]